MVVIGVTGATGTGKSTFCDMIAGQYGFKVINADAIAFTQSEPGSDYLKQIEKTFGKKVINKDKSLNRKVLGEIIFNDESQRQKLNKITKRYVVSEIEDLLTIFIDISNKLSKNKEYLDAIILDVPLLYEFKLDLQCNYVIALKADDLVKQNRIMTRQGLSSKEANTRINAQKKYDKLNNNADYFVENNGTEDELQMQMEQIMQDIARKENVKLI